jgi:sugar phosphate isomerase/epimerase
MRNPESNRILCSTGAIGYYPVNPDADHMLRIFPLLSADGYEVMIDRAVPLHAAEWSTRLRDAGVPVGMVHIGKQTGECFSSDDPARHEDGLLKLAGDLGIVKMFGSSHAVLHLWGWPDNDRNFGLTLQSMEKSLHLAAAAGVELLVETIPCVARPLVERLRELSDAFPLLRYTVDSRLLALQDSIGPVLEADWLWHGGKVAHVHVSDCSRNAEGIPEQRPILQPGSGCIDFGVFFAGLRARKYTGAITLEAPAVDTRTREVDADLLNRSFRYIREAMRA